MGFQDGYYHNKTHLGVWRFIGELALNLGKNTQALNVGALVVNTQLLHTLLSEKHNISGFSGISIQFIKSSDFLFPAWRVVHSRLPQKSFSLNKYGMHGSFYKAVQARCKMLDIDISIEGVSAPDKNILIEHIESRLSAEEWKKNNKNIVNIVNDSR